MKHLRSAALACVTTIIFGLASCSQVFSKLDDPADPKAADYQGYPTVLPSAEIAAVSPADGGNLTSACLTIVKVAGATGYELVLATTAAALATTIAIEFPTNIMDISASLVNSSTYYWKARAKDSSGAWGDWTKSFSFTVSPTATPTFEPVGGTYAADQRVTLTDATVSSVIYYTMDGTTPTTASTKYTGAISVTGNGTSKTIKAIAISNCTSVSGVASDTYTIRYGSVWTARTLPSSQDWVPANYHSVTYGNGFFVAVGNSHYRDGSGDGDRGFAAASPDGINWTAGTIPSIAAWSSVTYGNGTFVAIGSSDLVSNNVAATSTDGITWTARTLPSSAIWSSVAYGSGVFVATTDYSTGTAATSPDGITWTARTLPGNSSYSFWDSVTYGNGVFVAIDAGGRNRVATSSDGITWTARTSPSVVGSLVTYGKGFFVGLSATTAATSVDGITWATTPFQGSNGWSSLTYGNGIFVAVAGDDGTLYSNSSNAAMTSADGITWIPCTLPSSANWSSVAYGNGGFVAVSNVGTVAATSP